jgi:hypothetical protein
VDERENPEKYHSHAQPPHALTITEPIKSNHKEEKKNNTWGRVERKAFCLIYLLAPSLKRMCPYWAGPAMPYSGSMYRPHMPHTVTFWPCVFNVGLTTQPQFVVPVGSLSRRM